MQKVLFKYWWNFNVFIRIDWSWNVFLAATRPSWSSHCHSKLLTFARICPLIHTLRLSFVNWREFVNIPSIDHPYHPISNPIQLAVGVLPSDKQSFIKKRQVKLTSFPKETILISFNLPKETNDVVGRNWKEKERKGFC